MISDPWQQQVWSQKQKVSLPTPVKPNHAITPLSTIHNTGSSVSIDAELAGMDLM